jgi:transposase-like protein
MAILNGNGSFMTCPLCASEHLHRSRGRGIYERILLRAIGKYPYRCDECDERFYAQRPKVPAAVTQAGATD